MTYRTLAFLFENFTWIAFYAVPVLWLVMIVAMFCAWRWCDLPHFVVTTRRNTNVAIASVADYMWHKKRELIVANSGAKFVAVSDIAFLADPRLIHSNTTVMTSMNIVNFTGENTSQNRDLFKQCEETDDMFLPFHNFSVPEVWQTNFFKIVPAEKLTTWIEEKKEENHQADFRLRFCRWYSQYQFPFISGMCTLILCLLLWVRYCETIFEVVKNLLGL